MSVSRLVVALDFADPQHALALAAQLDPTLCRVKVGKELFTRAGPALVEALQRQGFDVFLDLKYHDIPNTTAQACRAAAELGVWMVNVHALGGPRMMDEVKNRILAASHQPVLIAVTVLTSHDANDLAALGFTVSPAALALRLATLAAAHGMDGVVCSAQEVAAIKAATTPQFATVTPGIRPAGSSVDDQSRILTPAAAIQAGSDYLVVGRPITQAPDPVAALLKIHAEMAAAQAMMPATVAH